MKILTLADVESKGLWDFLDKDYLQSVDLILAAGDLKPDYLEFLAMYARADILYVFGNHDLTQGRRSPGGCICVEDMVYNYGGVRILGLGGSMRYKPGPNQYTEKEMEKRIRKLRRQLKKNGGFDILLTHSPAKDLGDAPDLTHTGFTCMRKILEDYHPKYMVHGNVHLNYGPAMERVRTYGDTTIINAFEKYEFEF